MSPSCESTTGVEMVKVLVRGGVGMGKDHGTGPKCWLEVEVPV